MIKRIIDVFVSAVLLILLVPLFAIIGIAIKLGSPGPVFFRQERLTKNGKTFSMLKFRTMQSDAEKAGPRIAAAEDPRATKFGAKLRRTLLDELPQIWNVFWGDMSLVGPRAERPFFHKKFSRQFKRWP